MHRRLRARCHITDPLDDPHTSVVAERVRGDERLHLVHSTGEASCRNGCAERTGQTGAPSGVRVGELSALTFDCIRQDDLGNTFLKVPLGKMNSERLVPLDERTRALIEKLREGGRPDRELLLETPRGRPTRRFCMQIALDEATAGIETTRVTTHRLRHTYATTLLNAGMSLVSIMKLLGHRNYQMTLRYAAITQETVGREYGAALAQLEQRYLIPSMLSRPEVREPSDALSDVILWVQKRRTNDRVKGHALVKRLKRIRDELQGFSS